MLSKRYESTEVDRIFNVLAIGTSVFLRNIRFLVSNLVFLSTISIFVTYIKELRMIVVCLFWSLRRGVVV